MTVAVRAAEGSEVIGGYTVRVMGSAGVVPSPEQYRKAFEPVTFDTIDTAPLGRTLALVDVEFADIEFGSGYATGLVAESGTPTYFALHERRDDSVRSLGKLIAILRPAKPVPIIQNSHIQIPVSHIASALVMYVAKYTPAGPEAFAELGAELELMRLPD